MRLWQGFSRWKKICPLIRGVRLLECPLIASNTVEYIVAPWCSDYHYYTRSFNETWSQFLRRFNPARSVSDIRDDEDLWQWSRLEIMIVGQPYHKNNLSSLHNASRWLQILILFGLYENLFAIFYYALLFTTYYLPFFATSST